ncbi:hypothetical protein [Halorussus salinus]|nr:hypothetical protein [Halorussus salinus]
MFKGRSVAASYRSAVRRPTGGGPSATRSTEDDSGGETRLVG